MSIALNDNLASLNIYKKIFTGFCLVLIIPYAALLYLESRQQQDNTEAVKQRMADQSDYVSLKISNWLIRHLNLANILARMDDMQSMDPEKQIPLLNVVKEQSPSLVSLRVDDITTGNAIARSDNKPLRNYSDRKYFQDIKQGKSIGHQVIFAKTWQKPVLCLSIPIKDDQKVLLGSLNQCSILNDIAEHVLNVRIGTSGHAFLVDSNKQLVAWGGSPQSWHTELSDFSKHPALIDTPNNSFYKYFHEGAEMVAHKSRVGLDWTLVVQQTATEAFKPVIISRYHSIGVFVITVLMGIGFSIWVGRIVSTPLEQAHQELKRLSLYDSLTSVANLTLFNDRMERQIRKADRKKIRFLVVMLDFKDFKLINDSKGHNAGNVVLKTISARINTILRPADTLARVGGDEFAILADDVFTPKINQFAERILSTCDAPVVVDDESIKANINLGIAIFPDHGLDAESLLKKADIALYEAKRYNQGFVLFNQEEGEGADQNYTETSLSGQGKTNCN